MGQRVRRGILRFGGSRRHDRGAFKIFPLVRRLRTDARAAPTLPASRFDEVTSAEAQSAGEKYEGARKEDPYHILVFAILYVPAVPSQLVFMLEKMRRRRWAQRPRFAKARE